MAANDYFNSFNPSRPKERREDAPLPPIPSAASPYESSSSLPGGSGISPSKSPFTDNAYPLDSSRPGHRQDYGLPQYHTAYPEDTAYLPASERIESGRNDQDPFTDQNAIPLKSTPHVHGQYVGGSAMGANGDAENQFLQDETRRKRRHRYGQDDDYSGGKKPWYKRRVAWACWFLSAVQLIVFIIELVRNASLTGSPIQLKPQFNPMIGPSPYVLINMGARFVPCMRNVENVTDSAVPIFFPCPDATTFDTECTLSQLCGLSGVPNPVPGGSMDDRPEPNQWYRFIIPIFLHAGLVHIGFNLLLQLTLGREVEKKIGTLRFCLVYFSAGIFGFVFGGNYAALGIASCGASGSLFGLLALLLLDLLYHWSSRAHPVRELLFILLDIAIAFVLGLLPGLDNFSHIGGFLMGLVLGVCILHSPAALRERTGQDDPPYGPVGASAAEGALAFARAPVGFFKGRKPWWWAWWLIRVGALVGVLVGFILLLRNFYVDHATCGWCKYLSCIDINNWCDIGNLQFSSEDPGKSTKRDLFGMQMEAMRMAGVY